MSVVAYVNFSTVKYCLIKQIAVDLKDRCVFYDSNVVFFKTVSSGQREFVYNEPEFSQFLVSVVEDCLHYFPLRLILHFTNCRENGYKLWVQWFLASFGWTSICYDWSMVFKATINQSYVTLVHKTIPEFVAPKASCTHSPYSFWSGE